MYEQGDFVLPVLEVRDCDFDWKSFLDASGMNWDGFEALKHTGTMFSVLSFFCQNCKVDSEVGRSLGCVVPYDHLYMHYVMSFNQN